jgi:hypothetical protein
MTSLRINRLSRSDWISSCTTHQAAPTGTERGWHPLAFAVCFIVLQNVDALDCMVWLIEILAKTIPSERSCLWRSAEPTWAGDDA